MKKSNLVIIAVLFSTLPLMAEKMSLCKAFEKIAEAAKTGFTDINSGTNDPNATLIKTYATSVEILGAEKTELVYFNSTDFIARYGKFTSEESAIEKVETLKADFMKCYPFFKFSPLTRDDFKSLTCNFIQHSDNGFRVYKSLFKIEKMGGSYEVTFRFPQYSKKTLFYPEAPIYFDYTLIDKVAGYDQFSNDLRKVIVEAKTAFENLKGNEIESSFYMFKNYAAKMNVAGYSNCYVEDRTFGVIFYVIPCITGGDFETTKANAQSIISKVKSALGNEYGFMATGSGTNVKFVNKKFPDKNVLTISIESKKNSLYDIKILVDANVPK